MLKISFQKYKNAKCKVIFAVRFPMITWPDDRHPFSGVALASCQIGLARPR